MRAFSIVLVPLLACAAVMAIPVAKEVKEASRALDSLGGGHLLREVDQDSPRSLDSLGDGYLLARSLDSLGGGNLLRRQLDSLGGGYLLRREAEPLPYYYRREFKRAWDPMGGSTFGLSKRNFDEINRDGFEGFVKKNFDEIDRDGFSFVKKNFDEIDRDGFSGFVKKKRPFI